MPDILESRNYGTPVSNAYINNGSGWILNNTWAPPVTFVILGSADTGARIIDLNGDGLPDIVSDSVNGSSVTRGAWLNTGSGWNFDSTWQTPEAFSSNGKNVGRRLVDVNGDGFSDYSVSIDATNYTWIRNDTRAYLLANITNEYGGVTTITYNYSTSYDNTVNNISQIGICITVVGGIVRNNSMIGAFSIVAPVNYSYSGGKYSYFNNEFRGFAVSNETYPSKVVSHAWYQDDARKGKELSTTLYDPNGSLISKSISEWNSSNTSGVFNLSKLYDATYQYDGLTTPVIHNITYSYNVFGNPQFVSDLGDINIVGDERYTNYTYGFDTTDWIINKVSEQAVYDANNNKVKDTKFYYDQRGLSGVGPLGDLTEKEEWNSNGNNTFTYNTYDTYGNTITTTDSLGHTTKNNYDATYTYLANTINPLGYITRFTYNATTGQLLTTEQNGITTQTIYDQFGRPIKTIAPYDDEFLPTTATTYGTFGVVPYVITSKSKMTANKSMVTRYFYDGFGDVLQVKQDADNNQQIVKNIFYDASMRAAREQNPYFDNYSTSIANISTSAFNTSYTYDPADRVIQVTNPDGTVKHTTFSQYNITDYDENNNKHLYVLDGRGHIAEVHEYNIDPILGTQDEYITTYNYDGNDNLIKITDNENNQFQFAYDSLGRKTRMIDPDMGTWTYNYDTLGNLESQTDNRNQTTTLSYDPLNRILSKSSANLNSSFFYDSQYLNTLASINTSDGNSLNYTYDEQLRVATRTSTIFGSTELSPFYYSSQDSLIKSRYSLGNIDEIQDSAGFTQQVPNYLTSATINPFGVIASRSLASGSTISNSYDSQNNRLTQIYSPSIINLTYKYDAVGNIISINDSIYGRNHSLRYDSLYRLIYAAVGPDVWQYSFDSLGRIKNQIKDNTSMKYIYGATPAHAPSEIINGSTGVDVYKTSALYASNKTRVFEFALSSDLNNSVSGVNTTVAFGDGQSFAVNNFTLNQSTLFFVQNNYSHGGGYAINVSATSPNISDWQKFNFKFGARAYTINKLYSNASNFTFEFIGGNDINETIYNASWNCTLVNSSISFNLSGLTNITDYLDVNYNFPGAQTFSCTIQSNDGNESASLPLQINGLTINDYDILERNISSKIISYDIKNEFNSTTANISMLAENTTSSELANISTGESILIFAQVNYLTDGLQSFTTTASAFGQTQNYTDTYTYRGASIDNYARVSTSNLSQIYLFDVVNNWLNGNVSWNISDPNIANSAILNSNQSVMIFIQTNYSAGTKKPTIQAQRASYLDTIQDQFNIEPLQMAHLNTLVESPTNATSEIVVQNNLNTTQFFNWNLDNSISNISSNLLLNVSGSNLFVYIQSNYSTSDVYAVNASINSSTYTDSKRGVIVAS